MVLGDDNALSLTFNARNEGEGGAYEAELLVVVPPEADYSGIARNNEVRGAIEHRERAAGFTRAGRVPVLKSLVSLGPQSLSQLTCSYELENQTRLLYCDLGNPMKSGTNVRARLLSGFCISGVVVGQSIQHEPKAPCSLNSGAVGLDSVLLFSD